jgi:predicted nucleic acid-binding protein
VVLVDTNVLVYALDVRDSAKHCAARHVLRALRRAGLCVSTQVLSEYASVLTHPSKLALSSWDVVPRIMDMTSTWEVLLVTTDTVVAALEAQERWRLAYYDAQIWAAAQLNTVPVVLSEDFTDGLILGGVTFVNPFAEGFDMSRIQ